MSSALRGFVPVSQSSAFIAAICGSMPHAKIKPEHCVGPFFLGYVTALTMSRGDRTFEISIVAGVVITLLANAMVSGSSTECCEGKIAVLMIPNIQFGVVGCGLLLSIVRHVYHVRRGDYRVLDEERGLSEERRSEASRAAVTLLRQEYITLYRLGFSLLIIGVFAAIMGRTLCVNK